MFVQNSAAKYYVNFNVITRIFICFKRLQIGYIAAFQRNAELDFECILDPYNFFEWQKWY